MISYLIDVLVIWYGIKYTDLVIITDKNNQAEKKGGDQMLIAWKEADCGQPNQ